MSALSEHVVVLLVALICVVTAALGFLSRYEIERPPVGVYTFPDIAFMATAVVVVPLLYLHVPIAIEACLFGIVLLTILYYTLQPVLPRRAAIGCALALLATDAALGIAATPGPTRTAYLVVNDVVLAVALLGVANLYAQSGMRAAHVALFAAILAAYDYIATAVLPTTADLVAKLGQQPFAPQIVVGAGHSQVGIGLGDTLMLTLWTVVVRKAFGRVAGLFAAAVGIGAIAVMLAAFLVGALSGQVPAMTLLGPLIVVQYVIWRRRAVRERTTGEWRAGVLPQPLGPAIDPTLAVEVGLLLDRLAAESSTEGRPAPASRAVSSASSPPR